MARSTGSLIMAAPGGITAEARPLKVSLRSEAGMIAEPWSRSAMWAAPIRRGEVPNVFDSSTRAMRPPILVFTIMRMVWLLKLRRGAGPGFAGAAAGAPAATGLAGAAGIFVAIGEAAQVATQCSWASARLASKVTAREIFENRMLRALQVLVLQYIRSSFLEGPDGLYGVAAARVDGIVEIHSWIAVRRDEFDPAAQFRKAAGKIDITELVSAPAVAGPAQTKGFRSVAAVGGECLESSIHSDETRVIGAHHGGQHGEGVFEIQAFVPVGEVHEHVRSGL